MVCPYRFGLCHFLRSPRWLPLLALTISPVLGGGCGTPASAKLIDLKTIIGKPEAVVEKLFGQPLKHGTDQELQGAYYATYTPPKGLSELRANYDSKTKTADWIQIQVQNCNLSEEQVLASIGLDTSKATKERALSGDTEQTYLDRFRKLPTVCAPATALEIHAEPYPPIVITPGPRKPAPVTVNAWTYSISVYCGDVQLAPG
jgi:hypothetical protein